MTPPPPPKLNCIDGLWLPTQNYLLRGIFLPAEAAEDDGLRPERATPDLFIHVRGVLTLALLLRGGPAVEAVRPVAVLLSFLREAMIFFVCVFVCDKGNDRGCQGREPR